jgi:predicted ATP-binding protein involved in virulence
LDIESAITKTVDTSDSSVVYENRQGEQRQFSQYFKQYLVNKKVSQAFDQLESNQKGLQQTQDFFDSFTNLLRNLFEDKGLQLIFIREEFEFFIALSDGRRMTFNQLSEGFSAFLSIITELLMRVDFIRRRVSDFSFDPPGIVLIDEPETHLHLEMQYQVLPILTKLFPNIQFIAATHSPAVISSIPNATIYDLSTQVTRKEQVAGSSFSELMLTHFGLENEFSPVADRIIEQVNGIIENVQDKQAAKAQLKQILDTNREVLTPSLQLELESAILELEND